MFVYHECLRQRTVTAMIAYLDKDYKEQCYVYEKSLLLPQTNGLGAFMIEAINAFCKEYQRLGVDSIVEIEIKEAEDDDFPVPSSWCIGGYN